MGHHSTRPDADSAGFKYERIKDRARLDCPQAHRDVAEMYQRPRWERFWRQSEFWTGGYSVVAVLAEVDRIDQVGRPATQISFQEARAYARRLGVTCACHDGPEHRGAA